MKFGFSKSQLQAACLGVEIEFVHIPQLGIESDKRLTNNFIRVLTPSIFDSWLFFNLYSNYFIMCQRRINCLNIYHLTYIVNNQMVFGKNPTT